MAAHILQALGLADSNSGTYLGNGEWSTTADAGVLEPINPSNNEVIARVQASSEADYELIMQRAQAAFKDLAHHAGSASRRGRAPVR
jgi:aldehyde dehydrogenase (NAD+)